MQPDGQVVGEPGGRGGQALCFVVVGEGCGCKWVVRVRQPPTLPHTQDGTLTS